MGTFVGRHDNSLDYPIISNRSLAEGVGFEPVARSTAGLAILLDLFAQR